MTTRPRERPLSRQLVYEAAIELFEKKGYRGTSMNEVASACGVSKPALYHYYRSKSALLESLYMAVTEGFWEEAAEVVNTAAPAEERLARLIRAQVAYNIANRSFLTVFWRERHELDRSARAQVAEKEREYEDLVEAICIQGQRDRAFRQGDPRVMMYAVLGLLSTVHRWAPYTRQSPVDVLEMVTIFILDGIRTTQRSSLESVGAV